ncbi:TetR/AcrR family transcriptional regulator [Bradyrhizobium sp.]|uniref:TetR/AcrR family transcriptional regulator n=1 Tax=Bradyrhizobium sp. TaxID=376 RepID=UPI003C1B098B
MARTEIKALERTIRRGGGGRPTREEAEARDVRLLDVATRLFMERGFDGTSIDAVAEAAGVSKPTVYARYHDKRDLFAAVLRGRIRKWLAPLSAAAEAQATETSPKSIKTTLHELSRHMVAYTLAPEAAAVQRILSAQAVHFPELAKLANEEGWLRAVRGVASILRQSAARGQIKGDDPELAADMFLNLVLGHSKRLAVYGIATDPETAERHRKAAVDFFLNGMRTK